MIVSIVKGNLIDLAVQGKYKGIAHGCNCQCVMGAGIAPQIASVWPDVREQDNLTLSGDSSKLGYYTMSKDSTLDMKIFNLYTQEGFGGKSTGQPDVNYRAIKECFIALNKFYVDYERNREYDERLFGIPQIGAGLAGGHWEAIELIINMVTPNLPIELVLYNGQ
jgi:O-acetyl-ADP-ribose deacetylase (regulator of RNase III)